ncbi:MAG: DUF4384 domain-containing protein [Bacteroidaceae bacterium]|nr:DUF4384 domain-containing protein [Bacteroidaceae bacterium]
MNLHLKIIICLFSWCLCFNVGAQGIKKIRGEYTYYPPETVSPVEAFKTAVERAKLQALADEFGTLITQADGSVVENKSGKSYVDFISVSETVVRGEWLEDIKEPETERKLINDQLVYIAKVYGKARKITTSGVDFRAKVLRNGTSDKNVDVEFYAGDDLYLSFETPVDGYLAVYLQDAEHNVYCLYPYREDTDGKEFIKHGERHVLFSRKEAPIDKKDLVDEYYLTAQKSIEQNIIYIMFSPNEFTKATDVTAETNLPRMLSQSEFIKWKNKCRSRDSEMRVDIQNISIKQNN